MPNLTIKGVPEDTLFLLRKKASDNSRSLNKEIIALLDRYSRMKALDIKQLLKEVEKAKYYFKGSLSASQIKGAIKRDRQ